MSNIWKENPHRQVAVCHADNSNKFFQRPACVGEPGEGRTEISPRRSKSSSGSDLLRVSSSHLWAHSHKEWNTAFPSAARQKEGLPELFTRGHSSKAWSISSHAQGKRSRLCFKSQKVSAQQNPLFSPCSITTPSWRRISSERQDLVNSGQTAPALSEEQRIPGVPAAAPAQPGTGLLFGVHTDWALTQARVLWAGAGTAAHLWEALSPDQHTLLHWERLTRAPPNTVHCCTESMLFNFLTNPKILEYCHSKIFLFCCNMIPVMHWDAEKTKENSGKIAIIWIIFAI